MRAIPQFTADFDEYPELRVLADAALRRVVELMTVHGIVELKRLHKKGIFEHPYTKDIIVPLEIPVLPHTVMAVRYTVGKALLDYLEAVGVSALQLEMTQEDAAGVMALWSPPAQNPPQQRPQQERSLDPEPVGDVPEPQQAKDPEPRKEPARKQDPEPVPDALVNPEQPKEDK